jgi:hypothetical protein
MKYQKEHIEDVANILKRQTAPVSLINEFADLFAADNPQRCARCLAPTLDATEPCVSFDSEHVFTAGFGREQFLAACGLKS